KDEFRNLLFKILKFIDVDIIRKFNNRTFDFYIIQGILGYFKNEDLCLNRVLIEDIDEKNNEILLKYYFKKIDTQENIFIDGKEISAKNSKIKQYNFMDKVFLYEKRFWIKLEKNSKNLEIFINSKQASLQFENEKLNNLQRVQQKLSKWKKIRNKNNNLWLFSDMKTRADDNAEHLYRYIMQNYPEQNIVFILRKDSIDYPRLKKEKFNLVDPRSLKFKYLLYKSSKIISSHIDKYIFNAFGGDTLKNKDFVFLQHGVTKDDLSRWLNQRKIDMFITSTKAEYDSIAGDFNYYKFSTKEVVLTGMARWDALVKNNTLNIKQILITPTWREYLSGRIQKCGIRDRNSKFLKSLYFQKWQELLCSKELEKLAVQYRYNIVFIPHPQAKMYLEDFNLPSYIITSYKKSMQELFCKSSLMITDYSSVAFDMAVLKKPVLYYQFDKKDFFSNHSYKKGYFNYKKDGFGVVVEDKKSLFKELENLLKNNCKVTEPYRSNMENTFIFKDGKCCERIYKKLTNI
ncbi:capsular biosynthesis protein, partial [Campylobacter coli]|nr:capsular biosynthesis protein [Campylobacter coli]